MSVDWYNGKDDIAPIWLGAMHESGTLLLPKGSFEGEFVAKRGNISYYSLTKGIGDFMPVGYIVGEKP